MTQDIDMVCWECGIDMEPEKRVGLYLKFYCPKCMGEPEVQHAGESLLDTYSEESLGSPWGTRLNPSSGVQIDFTQEELTQSVAALRAAIAMHRLIGTGRAETINNIHHVESALEKLEKALKGME